MHTTQPSHVIRFALISVLLFSILRLQPTRPAHAGTLRMTSISESSAGSLHQANAGSTALIIYVKGNATGANNGTSWEDAFTDLQSALAVASSGDEIWVAEGTYKPTTGTDRTVSFVLKNGVAVYGGFAGTETLQTQRDPAANVTILSGEIGTAGNSDNSYHVVVTNSVNISTTLEGVTITDGNANGASPYDSGGGLYTSLDTFGQVNLDLTGVVFSNNTARGDGGGMSARYYVSPTATSHINLTRVTFTNNVSSRTGGGLSNNGGNLTLSDVNFIGNSALGGGGLSNAPYPSSTLINVIFNVNNG